MFGSKGYGEGKLKLKVSGGAYSALQPIRLIVPLPPRSSLIHLQRRYVPHRHERPLLAKEGTIQEFGKHVIHGSTRFFYMLQSWDKGQILSLPLQRKDC
jgi:hypothetical protein